MKNSQISASALIDELSKNTSKNIQLLVENLKLAQEKALQKNVLVIEIDSDDDFSVNGQSNFYGEFPIEVNITETFKNAIDGIDFGSLYPSSNKKLNYFLEGIRSKYVVESLQTGSTSFGGNQTLDAYIQAPTETANIGDLVINLKS